ncbi:MAG TPA: hypothetical protein PK860_01735 [Paludibacteraceae bacterium]|nr:hypothetical protein [Paludibacteraceae bacterium]
MFFESKLPDGSSAKITEGWFIRARATATRCLSPPDNSFGLCSIRSANCNSLRISFALFTVSLASFFAIKAGIITFSRAVNSGNN